MSKDRYYNIALLEAKNSTHTHKHASLIVKGGKVIAKTANRDYRHAEERLVKWSLLSRL